ncbi:MAG: glycogen/starch synthase [Bacillus subtilis]|nr:glycogen/starch synthase [Bacillus subtilis]
MLDSVVMNQCVIGEGAVVKGAILDKETVVLPGAEVFGDADDLFITEKKQIVANDENLKVLQITAECTPFIKTGGLADVVGALAVHYPALGVRSHVMMPLYAKVKEKYHLFLETVCDQIVPYGGENYKTSLYRIIDNGANFYFVESYDFFDRPNLYGYADDGDRFAFFAKAAIGFFASFEEVPDVVHIHDWHPGLIPLLMKRDERYKNVKTILTVHNVDYQGVASSDVIKKLGVADYQITSPHVNFLESALYNAEPHHDRIADLSRRTALRVLREEPDRSLPAPRPRLLRHPERARRLDLAGKRPDDQETLRRPDGRLRKTRLQGASAGDDGTHRRREPLRRRDGHPHRRAEGIRHPAGGDGRDHGPPGGRVRPARDGRRPVRRRAARVRTQVSRTDPPQHRIRRRQSVCDLRRRRRLSDAVAVRAVRHRPDDRAPLRHHSDRPADRRAERHRRNVRRRRQARQRLQVLQLRRPRPRVPVPERLQPVSQPARGLGPARRKRDGRPLPRRGQRESLSEALYDDAVTAFPHVLIFAMRNR